MAEIDWDFTLGGDAGVIQRAYQHANVPAAAKLSHDVWARKVDNEGGTGFGRLAALYATSAPSYGNITYLKDISVRSAMCMAVRANDGSHLSLGVRMDGVVPTTTGNDPVLCTNGYILRLFENGTGWEAELNRVIAGVATQLWSTVLAAGSPGDYKWFHLRLDFLRQPNGDATLQVFDNDLSTNPILPGSPPGWGTSWNKIGEVNDLAANVPATTRVGWGSQIAPGAGGIYETYVDWTEVWHS